MFRRLVLIMLMLMQPLAMWSPVVAQAANPTTLAVGDYVTYGSYYGQPILWRVIQTDGSGNPVLFAERLISIKAFDAKGGYHGEFNRLTMGSNLWLNSNIRQWLNSDQSNQGNDVIDWTQNDPNSTNMMYGYNPYATEKGFLADGNFTEIERALIKPLTHKVLLSSMDLGLRNGGSALHGDHASLEYAVWNYDSSAYFHNVTDHVFFLSVKQLKEWVYDRGYPVTAKPTAQALANSNYSEAGMSVDDVWQYYLNTPLANSTMNVRMVFPDGQIYSNAANVPGTGIRPAVQLNASAIVIKPGGDGSAGAPYVIDNGLINDNEPPSAPTNLTATDLTDDSVTLSWSASTDNLGLAGYEVYRNGSLLTTLNAEMTSYTASGLSALRDYTFAVKAKDFAGQLSADIALQVTPSGIEVGDYVQFGKYNGQPIAWRVIDKDQNGDPLLFSDRILSLKAFDMAGVGNDYPNSTIRQWLNSAAASSPYGTEAGFLANGNFTSDERELIKPLTHKVLLDHAFAGQADDGSEEYAFDQTIADELDDDSNAYYKTLTDDVLLLSLKQLKEYVYNRGFSLQAKPTAQAVANSPFQSPSLSSELDWVYWLNTFHHTLPISVRTVGADGALEIRQIDAGAVGVRPAMKLDLSSSVYVNGAGSLAEPYLVETQQAPTDIALNKLTVKETRPVGEQVGLLTATDANNGETVSFALVSGEGDKDNAKFAVDGNKLVTAAVLSYREQTTFRVRIQVEDSGGLTYEKSFTITPVPANVQVSTNNKVLTITLNEVSFNASNATSATKKAEFLQSKVKVSRNADQQTPSYDGLQPDDKVDVKGDKLIVTLKQPLTTAWNRVQLDAGAIKDTFGNPNLEMWSDTFSADVQGPKLVSAQIAPTNKAIVLAFDEKIANAATGSTLAIRTSKLRQAIEISTNWSADTPGFRGLIGSESVTLNNNRLTINVPAGLSGGNNRIRVAAGALKDVVGKTNVQFTTDNLSADGSGPTILSTTLAADNATITVNFSEVVKQTAVGTVKQKAEALLGAVKLAGNSGEPLFEGLQPGSTVTFVKGALVIKSSVKLSGANNRIEIAAGSLKDTFGTANERLVSTPLVADGVTPTMASASVSGTNKVIAVRFSEPVKLAVAAASLKGKIKVTRNLGVADYSSLTGSDAVSFSNGTLRITLGSKLSGTKNSIQIEAGTFADPAGLTNSTLSSAAIAPDEQKPVVVGTVLGADNRTLTVAFSEPIVAISTPAALRALISKSTDGQNWDALITADTVKVSGNQLVVKLASPYAGTGAPLKIEAGAVRDTFGNSNEVQTCGAVSADGTGPTFD